MGTCILKTPCLKPVLRLFDLWQFLGSPGLRIGMNSDMIDFSGHTLLFRIFLQMPRMTFDAGFVILFRSSTTVPEAS